ncbi:hypothetical protein A3H75_02565 [Candidatus Uhrbacteria bacterium RIFCSPLOWO2_02_FULL_51_9]|uniref:Uncharacterized protein n=1 Tax=Candidatus Uhrbacteria bacterium RIFCSPLOWO2_02_FULL_51_9 TaxID=1802410 RepID=A0A1F7VFQ3_9BACT|nr:MAG: hypothetical protein A3H75_02565 [Candidatus Uhrbacteria bacterium RIFCSPLOWO2_02_FULL_51_9]
MVIKLPRVSENIRVIMQRLGYNEHHDRHAVEQNFVMRLSGERYPRFHGYVEEKPDGFLLKVHVDMQETKVYGPRHGGVYDGELLEQEAARILRMVSLLQKEDAARVVTVPLKEKRGFFTRLLGG